MRFCQLKVGDHPIIKRLVSTLKTISIAHSFNSLLKCSATTIDQMHALDQPRRVVICFFRLLFPALFEFQSCHLFFSLFFSCSCSLVVSLSLGCRRVCVAFAFSLSLSLSLLLYFNSAMCVCCAYVRPILSVDIYILFAATSNLRRLSRNRE